MRNDLKAASGPFSARRNMGGPGIVPNARRLRQFERAIIVERVGAGIARARAEGKHLGRPYINGETERAIRAALAAGGGIRATARRLGVGTSVVQRIKAERTNGDC